MFEVKVVSLLPGLIEPTHQEGVVGRAVTQGLLKVEHINPREFADDVHRTVDDRPYGGGPGMVVKYEPLRRAIERGRAALPAASPVVLLSAQGRRFDQAMAERLAAAPGLMLVAGRYEGVDERITTAVDLELSLGDFVLSGGELAAAVVLDAVARLLPGVLGHEESAANDSFAQGLLDCPHYTRPDEINGLKVPEVLASGDHRAIARWRLKQALGRTWVRRPDLLKRRDLNQEERRLLDEYRREFGAPAMHGMV